MSSGELPVCIPVGQIDLAQLAEAGQIHDMTEVYEQYASPLTRSILERDGNAPFIAGSIDGKLYGIPAVMPTLDSYSYLWVRTDWLEKLDIPEPETMEDLVDIMTAFTEDDPDGNGENDTFGMLLDKDLWFRLKGFFSGYHAYPQCWIENDSGDLVYGGVQPEMKAGLQQLREMYKNGLLDAEFGVKDMMKSLESLAAGKVGVFYGGHWESCGTMESLKENDPDAEFRVFELVSTDEEPAISCLGLNTSTWYAVRSDFEHPEAIVKMMNLFLEKLYGETSDYEHWGNDEVGGIWEMSPIGCNDPHANLTAFKEIKAAITNDTTDELKGVSLDYYNNMQSLWSWERMFGVEKSPFAVIEKAVDNNEYFMNAFVGAPTETMVEKWSTLEEMMVNMATNIITTDVDVETTFNKFVEDWESLGGTQITDEVNEWYDNAID